MSIESINVYKKHIWAFNWLASKQNSRNRRTSDTLLRELPFLKRFISLRFSVRPLSDFQLPWNSHGQRSRLFIGHAADAGRKAVRRKLPKGANGISRQTDAIALHKTLDFVAQTARFHRGPPPNSFSLGNWCRRTRNPGCRPVSRNWDRCPEKRCRYFQQNCHCRWCQSSFSNLPSGWPGTRPKTMRDPPIRRGIW